MLFFLLCVCDWIIVLKSIKHFTHHFETDFTSLKSAIYLPSTSVPLKYSTSKKTDNCWEIASYALSVLSYSTFSSPFGAVFMMSTRLQDYKNNVSVLFRHLIEPWMLSSAVVLCLLLVLNMLVFVTVAPLVLVLVLILAWLCLGLALSLSWSCLRHWANLIELL